MAQLQERTVELDEIGTEPGFGVTAQRPAAGRLMPM